MRLIALTLALVVFTAAPARAQDGFWERVGSPIPARGLAVTDTAIFAVGDSGVYALRPGDLDWTRLTAEGPVRRIAAPWPGTLLGLRGPDLLRSADGGATWATVLSEVREMPVLIRTGPHAGRLVVVRSVVDGAGRVAYSDTRGDAWEEVPVAAPLWTLGVLDPSPGWPGGRLVGVSRGLGVGYSDDGGVTWELAGVLDTPSYAQLQPKQGLAVAVNPVSGEQEAYVLPGGEVGHGSWNNLIATSDGVTWTVRNHFSYELCCTIDVPLVSTPDGALWRGGDPFGSGLNVSRDGGLTWALVDAVVVDIATISADAQGRLWATASPIASGEIGVYRSVEAVVASEPDAAPAAGRLLAPPHPNPADGAVTVTLTLAQPGAATVAVYDVLGRRVAVLHEGPLAAGWHALTLDTEGKNLAPGVYFVRAVTASGTQTRRLTVVR